MVAAGVSIREGAYVMKRLFILRHAKAETHAASKSDFDRALNDQGRRAAKAMGAYMKQSGYVPGVIACSSAVRTVETLRVLHPFLGEQTPALLRKDLYLAEASGLLGVIRSFDDNKDSAMILAHNPGVAELALQLSAAPKDEAGETRYRRLREKYSTCGLAVLEFPVTRWDKVQAGKGFLVDFMRPKDLD